MFVHVVFWISACLAIGTMFGHAHVRYLGWRRDRRELGGRQFPWMMVWHALIGAGLASTLLFGARVAP